MERAGARPTGLDKLSEIVHNFAPDLVGITVNTANWRNPSRPVEKNPDRFPEDLIERCSHSL